eukprot:1001077-Rhodomonas_salina.1
MLAWVDQPQPFANFADLLHAAGGSLDRIMQTQLSPADQCNPVTAEAEYSRRLLQAANARDAKDAA